MRRSATPFNALLLTVLFSFPALVEAGRLPAHPRLLVTKSDVAALSGRFKHADLSGVLSSFKTQLAYSTNGTVTADKPDDGIRQKMEALALQYLSDPATYSAEGKQAIQLAIAYLGSYGTIATTEVADYAALAKTDDMIIGAALVYDWCYPLMSASDKTRLHDAMVSVLKRTEYGLPSTSNTQYLSGHYGEMNPSVYLAMGIALYDEDSTFFKFSYNEQVKGFAPTRNPLYASGTHHQGAQYIHVRHYNEILQHFMLDKLGMSPYVKAINTITFRELYGQIPQKTDQDAMPEGDGHNGLTMSFPQIAYLSANLSRDPYLQYFARKRLSNGTSQAARLFVYYDPSVVPTNPQDNLCLSRYFPSPSGLMIARTRWDLDSTGYGSNTMVALMDMKEYNTQNHTHLDDGHFEIYFKGHLALDAGIYQGSDPGNEWGKTNYVNYYSRTVAHNSMLILDPNEPLPVMAWNTKATVLDGGQFFRSPQAWDNSAQMFAAGKSAQLLAHEIEPGTTPDYSYLKGDITGAYKVPSFIASYPSKVDTVRRSFVFLNHNDNTVPGSLIVFDKVVSTNASFKKTWLLHTQNQPVVTGNVVVATSTASGRNGKITTTVLLPEPLNQNIQLVGGPGKEYWVDGKNWGTVTQQDAGAWRVELSPVKSAKSANFLNVLQATTASNTKGLGDIAKTNSVDNRYVVVRVNDRIVAQLATLGTNGLATRFTLGDTGKVYKILVTDLKAGAWQVGSSSTNSVIQVPDSTGTLYFQSKGGIFDISPATVGVSARENSGADRGGIGFSIARSGNQLHLSTGELLRGTSYRIVDANGISTQSGRILSNDQNLSIANLHPGLYFLDIPESRQAAFRFVR